MQLTNLPPLPFLPDFLPQSTPVYLLSTNGAYVYDDRSVDYVAVRNYLQMTTSVPYPPGPGEGGYGGPDTNSYPPIQRWGPNDLWLEIETNVLNPGSAEIVLHGTATGLYQLITTHNLSQRFGVPQWLPGDIVENTDGTNTLHFPFVSTSLPMRFFRAVGGDTVVSVSRDRHLPDATERCSPSGNPQVGIFNLAVNPPVPRQLTIVYAISGSAQNGLDYTNLSGSVVLPANTSSTNIYVHPIDDNDLEFEESVTLTLVLTNGYLINPVHPSATCFINDCTTNLFTVVATNLPSPVEIDYHPPTKSLLLSVNFDGAGAPCNFAKIDTNGVVTQWSSVSNLYEEVKFAVAKINTNGWTNGCMFFGSDTQVGSISENGASVNNFWATLTNDVVTNAMYLRGSLCFDETGVWSNDLIAVTSDAGADDSLKGIWRINSSGQPFLVANVLTPHLEGVVAITNDPVRWGPWAGKILAGDESLLNDFGKQAGVIYSIDSAGTAVPYELGIQPEDFDVVPANQDLYCVNYNLFDSKILKLSKSLLTNFVGDLLITQAGEFKDGPKLWLVHWSGTNFVTRSISLPTDVFPLHFEHVTFAPIELPNIAD